MKPKKTKKQPRFEYHTGELEAKYRTVMNLRKEDNTPDWEAFRTKQQEISTNMGFCPLVKRGEATEDDRCHCREFRNSDAEAPCRFGLFTKVLRDPESFQKYMDDDPKFSEDEAVEKKRKKLEKEQDDDEEEIPPEEREDE